MNAMGTIEPNSRAQIDFVSDVKLTGGKKNPLQGKVTKITKAIVTFTGEKTYQNRVMSKLIEEGKKPEDYQPKSRPWGVRLGDTPIIEHNGETYIEFLVEDVLAVNYLVDGKITPKEEIEGFPEPKNESAEGQGGLEEKVQLRCLKKNNVLSINKSFRVV